MASHVVVVDATLKRTQIKVTPGKFLREILEEACKSRKLSPEEYSLKSANNKTLDLSQPFRLSGLSAGAKLQLTQASKSPGVVSVALQLPESEGSTRLSDKFPSNTSLWLMLRKYEDAVAGGGGAKKLNLTQRGVPTSGTGAGRLVYEQPCLNLLGRNLETFTDLQKTLAQLGLNGGSVLIRLSFKATETPLEEAMRDISEFFTSIDSVPAGLGSSASQGRDGAQEGTNGAAESALALPLETEAIQEPDEDVPLPDAPPAEPASNSAPPPSSSTSAISHPPQQPPPSNTINGISVYRPPTSSTPAAALQQDDPAVFEPSIDQAKALQASLQQAGKNKRLLSDKELADQEEARQAQLATVQSVTVRVRYPDQSQIETTITASQSPADLYAQVANTLAAPSTEAFELRYYGTSGSGGAGRTQAHETLPNIASKRLVRDFGFRGKVLVTMVWAEAASMAARQGPSLKAELRSHAQELKVELQTQQAESEQAKKVAMQKPEKKEAGGGEGKGKGDIEAKMKKFLGFGKK